MYVERDVVIVGAGPAGAISAAYLAKAGVDVLLVDKEIFPRDKACGDILREDAVYHINELGAFDELDKISACIRRLKLISAEGNEAVIPFECYSLPRKQLDDLLVRTAVGMGAEFRQDCFAEELLWEGSAVKGIRVREHGVENMIRAKIVIGADGACSQIAGSAGIKAEKSSSIWQAQRAYFKGIKLDDKLARDQYNGYGMFFFEESVKPGYFWVMPSGKDGVAEGICNVGMMTYDRDSYRGGLPSEKMSRWIEKNPVASQLFEGARQISPWQCAKLKDAGQSMVKCSDSLMLIGDAAALMNPLTKAGTSAAAASAKAAAEAAMDALGNEDFSAEFLQSVYEKYFKPVSEDDMKYAQLVVQSMYDTATMDSVVKRLAEDPVYAGKIENQSFYL